MQRLHLDFECDEPWDAMRPDGDGRRCARCDEQVIDLSRMPRKRALAVLARGGACVSFLEMPNGRALFRPQPHAAGRLAGLAAGLLAACAEPEAVVTPEPATVTAPPVPPATVPEVAPADCEDLAEAEVAPAEAVGAPPETPAPPLRRRGRRHAPTTASPPIAPAPVR